MKSLVDGRMLQTVTTRTATALWLNSVKGRSQAVIEYSAKTRALVVVYDRTTVVMAKVIGMRNCSCPISLPETQGSSWHTFGLGNTCACDPRSQIRSVTPRSSAVLT